MFQPFHPVPIFANRAATSDFRVFRKTLQCLYRYPQLDLTSCFPLGDTETKPKPAQARATADAEGRQKAQEVISVLERNLATQAGEGRYEWSKGHFGISTRSKTLRGPFGDSASRIETEETPTYPQM